MFHVSDIHIIDYFQDNSRVDSVDKSLYTKDIGSMKDAYSRIC